MKVVVGGRALTRAQQDRLEVYRRYVGDYASDLLLSELLSQTREAGYLDGDVDPQEAVFQAALATVSEAELRRRL